MLLASQEMFDINTKMQTDMFLPKPESPRYIPKKTGIDKIT